MADRRFGTLNKFGTGSKFGASSGIDSSIAWGVEIDWDEDGVFDGTNEASRMCGLNITRGRRSMLQSTGSGFELIETGKARITLWNDDGRYDGWNTASPLYPNVMYGKDVRIRVRDFTTGTIEPVFYGVIADIVPEGYDERPKVTIVVEDGWVFLRNYSARVSIQTNIAIEDAIDAILTDIRWPARWGTNLDTTVDIVPYWWASGDRKAATDCEDLANSVFGNFFIAADGSARYLSRTNLGASAADFMQADVYKDIVNPQPWVNYRNVMRLKVHPRDVSGTALLYECFGTTPRIGIGETYTLWANYTYNGVAVAAMSVVTPVSVIDYTLNTAIDGSGTDVTASCTVTALNLGGTAKVVITNGSGSVVYLTKMQLRGVALFEKYALDVVYPADPDSVEKPREFLMDLPWQQSPNVATDFTTIFGPFLEGLHPFPAIQIESNFAKQFGIELFETCTFTSDKLGIHGVSFRIGGIEHETVDDNCQRVITRFYLEPYVAGGEYGAWPLVFGTSAFGW